MSIVPGVVHSWPQRPQALHRNGASLTNIVQVATGNLTVFSTGGWGPREDFCWFTAGCWCFGRGDREAGRRRFEFVLERLRFRLRL